MEILVKNLGELEKFSYSFLDKLQPTKSKATVVTLSGDLGSGKTAFVKIAAQYFGVKESVTSPTFVLIKYYSLNAKRYILLIHIDAYRLKNANELLRLRFDELVDDPKNIIFIEWPENVTEAIPENTPKINFTFIDEKTRTISF